MYESDDIINDYSRRHGATEAEARVLYYLDRLAEAMANLPDVNEVEGDQFLALQQTVLSSVAVRVAGRDHPEGWRKYEDYE